MIHRSHCEQFSILLIFSVSSDFNHLLTLIKKVFPYFPIPSESPAAAPKKTHLLNDFVYATQDSCSTNGLIMTDSASSQGTPLGLIHMRFYSLECGEF